MPCLVFHGRSLKAVSHGSLRVGIMTGGTSLHALENWRKNGAFLPGSGMEGPGRAAVYGENKDRKSDITLSSIAVFHCISSCNSWSNFFPDSNLPSIVIRTKNLSLVLPWDLPTKINAAATKRTYSNMARVILTNAFLRQSERNSNEEYHSDGRNERN